jgi:hypothetical protein
LKKGKPVGSGFIGWFLDKETALLQSSGRSLIFIDARVFIVECELNQDRYQNAKDSHHRIGAAETRQLGDGTNQRGNDQESNVSDG